MRSITVRRSCTAVLPLFAAGLGLVSRGIATAALQPQPDQATTNTPPKRIFCFGGSLTAGTSPPGLDVYPYAEYLERALGGLGVPATFQWEGFPGWTSPSLLHESGFAGFLEKTQKSRNAVAPQPELPPFDLVIVLAGTSDLAYGTNGAEIFGSIRAIHEAALARGCPTLAVGIPPGGWKSEPAKDLATEVNEKLASWAATKASSPLRLPTPSFVSFPTEAFDPTGVFWAPDGLHFSERGYEFLGNFLAPTVAELLRG